MSKESGQCHRVEPTIGGWSYLSREPRPTPEENAAAIKKGEGLRKLLDVGSRNPTVQATINGRVNPAPPLSGDRGAPLSGISW